MDVFVFSVQIAHDNSIETPRVIGSIPWDVKTADGTECANAQLRVFIMIGQVVVLPERWRCRVLVNEPLTRVGLR